MLFVILTSQKVEVAYSLKSMQVKVLFFGVLKDVFGGESEMIEMPEGSCARDLLDRFAAWKGASHHLASLAIAVNHEYCQSETLLREGDEVALLPPVSGGTT